MASRRSGQRSLGGGIRRPRCEGFAVAGAAKGVVAELVHDGDPFVPDALVLRTGSRRTRRIEADVVVAVIPAERLLIVERRGPARRETVRRATSRRRPRLVPAARSVWRAPRPSAAAAAATVLAAFARLAAEALGALSDGKRLIPSAAWRRFAPSLRSVTTRLSRARWPRSLRRRTT